MSPHAVDAIKYDTISDSTLLKKFGITSNAFLPAEAPLQALPDELYAPWELLVHNLPLLLRTGRLRTEIDSLDVLHTENLRSWAEWRRAYVVLAFLAQGYVWGGEKPAQVSLRCPFEIDPY